MEFTVKNFTEMGRALGYPECCITSFENGDHIGMKVNSYNGFTPCPAHQNLSLEEVETLLGRKLVTAENQLDFFKQRGIII